MLLKLPYAFIQAHFFESHELFMNVPLMTKYVFHIRCRNGAVVDNLQVYGRDEHDAACKVEQMYRHCAILDSGIALAERAVTTSYEDVLNLIVKAA